MSAVSTVFWATMAITVVLDLSLLATLGAPSFQVWPPPRRRSWEYRLVWTLFPLAAAGLLITGGLDVGSLGLRRWIGEAGSLIIGTTLFGVGTTVASYAMGFLGRRAAPGLGDELITGGPYAWSRNPGYVGGLMLLAGHVILTDSRLAGIIALAGGLWFVIAPLAEEPWLEKSYGKAYLQYKAKHPRWLL